MSVAAILGTGMTSAPGQLALLALTCLPILVSPVIANARGHEAGWPVMFPIGVVLAATAAVLWWTLRRISEETR